MPAQVLLVPHDFVDRRQYLHARRTLTRLLELGCVPIVNENDAIANDEIRFGDNDRIAALVAHIVGADVLVLLTDLDGLYTADPRRDPDAALIARVAADDPLLSIRAGGGGSGRGSGGMAQQAGGGPDRVVVGRAHGDRQAPPPGRARRRGRRRAGRHDVRGRTAASCRPASCGSPSPRSVAGTVTVDDGARRALVERQTCLLPAGVIDVAGSFDEGDTVDVATARRRRRSPAAWCSSRPAQLRDVAGRRTSDLPPGMCPRGRSTATTSCCSPR